MGIGIGATLRETRNRRKIDLSEVEAATKIRIRYLRAMENEEWDVLPGDVYARGFIRTYASLLGLDGERLADEYQRGSDPPPGEGTAQAEPRAPIRQPRAAPRLSGRALASVVTLGVLALLIGLGLTGRGGEDSGAPSPSAKEVEGGPGQRSSSAAAQPGVAMRFSTSAEVWVCLLDAGGRPLVDGLVLEPGAEEGPFHSDSFTVSFGNGEVSMSIDGKQADIPATPSPVGYAIDPGGRLRELPEGERPTCT